MQLYTFLKRATGKLCKSKSASSFNKFLFSAVCVIAAFSASAQKDDENSFYIQAGASLSTIQNSAGSGLNKFNFLVGAGYYMPLEHGLDLLAELNFVEKGTRSPASQSNSNPAGLDQYRSTLMYLQPSVLLNLHLNEHFSVFLGPALGILTYSKEEDFNGEITGSNQTDYKPLDLSLVVGTKYYIDERMAVTLRLDQSILPMTDSGLDNNNVQGVRQFNTVLGINLSYAF